MNLPYNNFKKTEELTLAHLLAHSLAHSLACSLTRSPRSLARSLAHSLTHSLAHSLAYSLACSLTRLLTRSLAHSLTFSLTCFIAITCQGCGKDSMSVYFSGNLENISHEDIEKWLSLKPYMFMHVIKDSFKS